MTEEPPTGIYADRYICIQAHLFATVIIRAAGNPAQGLIKPPKIQTIRSLSQELRRYIPRPHPLALLFVTALVINDHIRTEG